MFNLVRSVHQPFKNDILSGLTVSLALIPEAIAFSFVAGVDPLVGLYAAFLVGFITGVIGGRPGMISGATGALAVVMVSLVAMHGVQYLFAAVILMGLIQIAAGALKLGKFVRLIPHPVMLGFVNGLAIVIFLSQLSQFKVVDASGALVWMQGEMLYIMLGLIALAMAIIFFLPKLTRAVPSTLVAIVSITVLVSVFGLNTRLVSDMASIGGSLPEFMIPNVPFSLETLKIIFPYSAILAAIGLIESLMTMQLVDELTETRGRSNQEFFAQGISNIVCGFFGAMGGCAMIGQSMINVASGGRGRMSAISAALFLLFFIVAGSFLIEMIPLAALCGVMFMVVLGTFEWSSVRILRKIPASDSFVIVLVSVVTVFSDLAVAVACGVVVSALVFAWKKSERIFSSTFIDEQGVKHYELRGPLFFGSVQSFQSLFDAKNDPDKVILDFEGSRICDHSSIEVINNLVEKYRAQGKTISLKKLSPDCASIVRKAGNLLEAKVVGPLSN